ncbi:AraC family transcriptional regulator [Aquibacillus salsiterrae]|uniref:AraC family transcriptional regulator n=1 Tax=Aquibacillus salsiterrae TaxID=2950439 RepID=A0A9X4AEL9_9BACI|nr:AraC family transcriptional regulator [Aquibacillus salsiterrae]MDC3416951.1 AraC family transcriptional regulator [Aquibacillus salsiterrae]
MNHYLLLDTNRPVEFVSAGQFVSEQRWTHMERNNDSYELIIGVKEVLYIEQGGQKYQVKPGEVLLLLPNQELSGYKECAKGISFYWFHFKDLLGGPLLDEKAFHQTLLKIRTTSYTGTKQSHALVPDYSKPKKIERINIIANQLLDFAYSNSYNKSAVDYFMTLLMIELSEQTLESVSAENRSSLNDRRISLVEEWIRIHALEDITVTAVANYFNYNRDYLSRFFKEKTNMNIREYIHRLKLTKAKDLLTSSEEGIKEIAYRVGIKDEKYFMRLFKKYEKVTPTEYRKAYFRRLFNNE